MEGKRYMPEAKILIVDDTKANLLALKALLKPIEVDIVTAMTGEERSCPNTGFEQVDAYRAGSDCSSLSS